MIYQSDRPPLNHNRYEQKFEYMFVFSKGRPKTFNPLKMKTINAGKKQNMQRNTTKVETENKAMKRRNQINYTKETKIIGNVWFYNTGLYGTSKDGFAFEHPAIFPEKLATDHILSWSNENDLIYDPFMGSGTTAKQCILTNRSFIGSEISKEYCKIAEKRIEIYKNNLFYKKQS
jgi:site-specific DNA-methyltransferase (adenine-specific)